MGGEGVRGSGLVGRKEDTKRKQAQSTDVLDVCLDGFAKKLLNHILSAFTLIFKGSAGNQGMHQTLPFL